MAVASKGNGKCSNNGSLNQDEEEWEYSNRHYERDCHVDRVCVWISQLVKINY